MNMQSTIDGGGGSVSPKFVGQPYVVARSEGRHVSAKQSGADPSCGGGLPLHRCGVEIKLNHYRPQAQKGRVPATLRAEHRMDDAPAGVEDRQADRCVYDHFEPERKIFHGILQ